MYYFADLKIHVIFIHALFYVSAINHSVQISQEYPHDEKKKALATKETKQKFMFLISKNDIFSSA